MNSVKTHHDLDVWKLSMDVVLDLYRMTEKFPSQERFGLVSQIRRASVSIPSNIAEGASRSSHKEFRYFVAVALGSASELEVQVEIASRLGFTHCVDQEMEKIARLRKMLVSLRRALQ